MKWQIGSLGLFYACGESMTVYFNPTSGDTHLVSDFAAYLIEQIAQQDHPVDQEEIIQLISADIQPADLAELSGAVPGILGELASLDIVVQD